METKKKKHFSADYQPIARWTDKAALFTVNDQMCRLWAATTPSMLSNDTFTLLYLMCFGVPNLKEMVKLSTSEL